MMVVLEEMELTLILVVVLVAVVLLAQVVLGETDKTLMVPHQKAVQPMVEEQQLTRLELNLMVLMELVVVAAMAVLVPVTMERFTEVVEAVVDLFLLLEVMGLMALSSLPTHQQYFL